MENDNNCPRASPAINPLDIHKILQQTQTFLEPCHLRKCRLVNSAWNQVAIPLLQKSDCLYLYCVKIFTKFSYTFATTDNPDNRIPYKSCIFASELMDPDSPEFMGFNSNAITFFDQFGKNFTQVHLSIGGGSESAVRSLLGNILFKYFTNLETLSILVKEGPFDFWTNYEESCHELTNLKSLHVQWTGYNSSQRHDMQNFLVPLLEKCVNLVTLSCKIPPFIERGDQSADVYSDLNEQLLQSILKCGENILSSRRGPFEVQVLLKVSKMKLESLTQCLPKNLTQVYLELDDSVGEDTLHGFLEKFTNLSTIHIEFTKDSNIIIPPARIPVLRQFTVLNYKGDFHFLNYLPTLKTLTIMGDLQPDFKSICNNDSLTCLKISSKSGLTKLDRFGVDILTSFPNLRNLLIQNVDNVTLRGIYKNLRELTSLHVIGKEISDAGICGEEDKMLRVLLESVVDDGVDTVWNFQPRFPHLADLKSQ
ncbi:hypothetical protein Fcan01_23569 [Folsomia candida]|uniref:Uncharacterized protein n=1 Tax=Folsomia candida TaxID=158441 RepID=A0A226DC83_FOLCA|nr:hypothetical protein Fcan01_23569 [Folsomia candida]